MQKILTLSNTKLEKAIALGYLSAGIHFAPEKLSGRNVCPAASEGCKAVCLNTSGHGAFDKVQKSRIEKTKWFFADREGFMSQLVKEIKAFEKSAKKRGLKPSLRLNLTSDIQWENIEYQGKTIFEHFPHIQFMDYTKIVKRILPNSKARSFANYHLTFSRSESNQAHVELALKAGVNVAAVFHGGLPNQYMGHNVIDADSHDLRFLDAPNSIAGLSTKGRAKKDQSGFVIAWN